VCAGPAALPCFAVVGVRDAAGALIKSVSLDASMGATRGLLLAQDDKKAKLSKGAASSLYLPLLSPCLFSLPAFFLYLSLLSTCLFSLPASSLCLHRPPTLPTASTLAAAAASTTSTTHICSDGCHVVCSDQPLCRLCECLTHTHTRTHTSSTAHTRETEYISAADALPLNSALLPATQSSKVRGRSLPFPPTHAHADVCKRYPAQCGVMS
jgi:hypothetical protein